MNTPLSLIVCHSYIVIVYHFLNCVVYFSDAKATMNRFLVSHPSIFLFICLYKCDLNYFVILRNKECNHSGLIDIDVI